MTAAAPCWCSTCRNSGAINDSFGRYVGDSLIEKIAARLKQTYAGFRMRGLFRRRHVRDQSGGFAATRPIPGS